MPNLIKQSWTDSTLQQWLYKIQKRPTSLFYHVLLIKQNECKQSYPEVWIPFQKEKWLKFNHVEATVMEALEKLNDLGAHHALWILELGNESHDLTLSKGLLSNIPWFLSQNYNFCHSNWPWEKNCYSEQKLVNVLLVVIFDL